MLSQLFRQSAGYVLLFTEIVIFVQTCEGDFGKWEDVPRLLNQKDARSEQRIHMLQHWTG